MWVVRILRKKTFSFTFTFIVFVLVFMCQTSIFQNQTRFCVMLGMWIVSFKPSFPCHHCHVTIIFIIISISIMSFIYFFHSRSTTTSTDVVKSKGFLTKRYILCVTATVFTSYTCVCNVHDSFLQHFPCEFLFHLSFQSVHILVLVFVFVFYAAVL